MIMQLTDAQRSILEPACVRDDRCIFPIEAKLKGGAVGNVCKSLLKRGLFHEIPASDTSTVWRHGEDGIAMRAHILSDRRSIMFSRASSKWELPRLTGLSVCL